MLSVVLFPSAGPTASWEGIDIRKEGHPFSIPTGVASQVRGPGAGVELVGWHIPACHAHCTPVHRCAGPAHADGFQDEVRFGDTF